MNGRILNEGQWEDRKQWSLDIGQRRKTFWNRHTYIHTYIHTKRDYPFLIYMNSKLFDLLELAPHVLSS
jgi:hypothetical protein